jgi:hypothetical protein
LIQKAATASDRTDRKNWGIVLFRRRRVMLPIRGRALHLFRAAGVPLSPSQDAHIVGPTHRMGCALHELGAQGGGQQGREGGAAEKSSNRSVSSVFSSRWR